MLLKAGKWQVENKIKIAAFLVFKFLRNKKLFIETELSLYFFELNF